MGVVVFFSSRADMGAVLIMSGVALVGFLGFVAIARDEKGRARTWGSVTWVAAGVMSAMVVLAGFSYGLFLLPAALAFLIAALLATRRRQRSLGTHLGFFLAGALGCVLVIALANIWGRL
jgi:hypothetical protein